MHVVPRFGGFVKTVDGEKLELAGEGPDQLGKLISVRNFVQRIANTGNEKAFREERDKKIAEEVQKVGFVRKLRIWGSYSCTTGVWILSSGGVFVLFIWWSVWNGRKTYCCWMWKGAKKQTAPGEMCRIISWGTASLNVDHFLGDSVIGPWMISWGTASLNEQRTRQPSHENPDATYAHTDTQRANTGDHLQYSFLRFLNQGDME